MTSDDIKAGTIEFGKTIAELMVIGAIAYSVVAFTGCKEMLGLTTTHSLEQEEGDLICPAEPVKMLTTADYFQLRLSERLVEKTKERNVANQKEVLEFPHVNAQSLDGTEYMIVPVNTHNEGVVVNLSAGTIVKESIRSSERLEDALAKPSPKYQYYPDEVTRITHQGTDYALVPNRIYTALVNLSTGDVIGNFNGKYEFASFNKESPLYIVENPDSPWAPLKIVVNLRGEHFFVESTEEFVGPNLMSGWDKDTNSTSCSYLDSRTQDRFSNDTFETMTPGEKGKFRLRRSEMTEL